MNLDTAKLRQTMTKSFNISELQTICFDLGIDYEDLSGSNKGDMVRELLRFAEQNGIMQDVVKLCAVRRPQIDWSPFLPLLTTSLNGPTKTATQFESSTLQPFTSDRQLGSMTRLQHALVTLFDTQEILGLCGTLEIDYDRLPGIGMEAKARSIITHFQRERKVGRLVQEIERVKGSLYQYY